MSDEPETALQFPLELTVKVMGLNEPGFAERVRAIIEAEVVNPDTLVFSDIASSGGKYISVRASFTADNYQELKRLYAKLREEPSVRYLL